MVVVPAAITWPKVCLTPDPNIEINDYFAGK